MPWSRLSIEVNSAVALKRIADGAGLAPSQTHRYLVSLLAGGMVAQDTDSGLYDLGPGAVALGLAALARNDAVECAAKALRATVDDTGWTGLLAVMGPVAPTVVRWYAGRPPVITTLALGATLPLPRSATGQVFLSYLGDAELAVPLRQEAVVTTDIAVIKKQVHRRISASVDSTLIPGLRALAAPIFDLQQRPAAVATVIAPLALPKTDDRAVRRCLLKHCQAATLGLGGQWPG